MQEGEAEIEACAQGKVRMQRRHRVADLEVWEPAEERGNHDEIDEREGVRNDVGGMVWG